MALGFQVPGLASQWAGQFTVHRVPCKASGIRESSRSGVAHRDRRRPPTLDPMPPHQLARGSRRRGLGPEIASVLESDSGRRTRCLPTARSSVAHRTASSGCGSAVDDEVIVAPRPNHVYRRTSSEHPDPASESQSSYGSEDRRTAVHALSHLPLKVTPTAFAVLNLSATHPAGSPSRGAHPVGTHPDRRPITTRGAQIGKGRRRRAKPASKIGRLGNQQEYIVPGSALFVP